MKQINLDKVKKLRDTLEVCNVHISADWRELDLEYDHYLAESLAALTIELDQNINLVNQLIGELSK